MSAAPDPGEDPRFQRLMDLVLDRLIDILEQGAPPSGKSAERAPAPAAYVSAAIKLLKDAGRFKADTADDLDALLADAPDFEA